MKIRLQFRWHPLWWLGLVAFLGMQACHDDGKTKVGVQTRPIIGGQPDFSHPGVGALLAEGRPFCTGTLIARRVVLTAAHCIDAAKDYSDSGASVQFRIDTPDPNDPTKFIGHPQDMDASLLTNHPSWRSQASNGYDVGTMILKTAVDPALAKVIPYNRSPLNAQWVGKTPLFLGYGLIESFPNAVSSDKKYGTTIPIIQVLNDRIVHKDTGKSVCHGDSGGPALETFNGQIRVFAVNSYVTAAVVPNSNPQRSRCDDSGVSMRTDTYSIYIESVLAKYGDGPASCKDVSDCSGCQTCDLAKALCAPISQPLGPKTCQACNADPDCGTGGICHRFADGYRCLQACTSEGCCPSDSECTLLPGRTAYACLPKANLCPALPCLTDATCGLGETCQNQTCKPNLPPRAPLLCAPCVIDGDCDGPGHLCHGPSSQGQCTQPCGAGDFCPAGFVCQALYPGLPKQCIPDKQSCFLPCVTNDHCPAGKGLTCQNSVCNRPQGGEIGDPCDPATCKTGLTCTATLTGKRCLQPCGAKPGSTGSLCDQGRCSDGSRCYSFGGSSEFCLLACSQTSDCTGGGSCSRGACFCQRDSDCKTGYACNTSTGSFGACVKDNLLLRCPAGYDCRTLAEGSFCVVQGPGRRSIGQRCDSVNRCLQGLVCVPTGQEENGGTCFEDCTQTQTCFLGGQCAQFGRSLDICICTEDRDCPRLRSCKAYFEGGYGLCEPTPVAPCLSDLDCPIASSCQGGICERKEMPPKEVLPELPAEPKSEPKPEPKPEPQPEIAPEVAFEKAPEDGGTESSPEPRPEPKADTTPVFKVGGGCSCSSSPEPSAPLAPLFLLAFLLSFLRPRFR